MRSVSTFQEEAEHNTASIATLLKSSVVARPKVHEFSVKNERAKGYLKGSRDRKALEWTLGEMSCRCPSIPIVIGNTEFRKGVQAFQAMPFDHESKVCKFHLATPDLICRAIEVSCAAQADWDRVPLNKRIKVWLRAADLMAGKYRMQLNAATMLGQGKTLMQAEIDAGCELVDFFRFNAWFAKELSKYRPVSERPSRSLNTYRLRGLEGFVAAITPFNFTAIAGNLATAPALMGCGVVWKPATSAVLSNYLVFNVLREAGLPPGVINFVPADGETFAEIVCRSPHLAGINFTGSLATYKSLLRGTAANLDQHRNLPRLSGELGGKNYHFVHPSADVRSVIMATMRAAFEYSGQKCSACSRLYVPNSLWDNVVGGLVKETRNLKVGGVTDLTSFTSAVIDEAAFKRIACYIENAKMQNSNNAVLLCGGECDMTTGYFIQPTIIQVMDINDQLMKEEIFGPVLAVYKYEDKDAWKTLSYLSYATPYALTGSIFAKDEDFLKCCVEPLRETTGNFYINDKCTGAVVGQQPFGGARLSGTNDKPGGPHYLLRWASPQVIKENFKPIKEWKYPYMTS